MFYLGYKTGRKVGSLKKEVNLKINYDYSFYDILSKVNKAKVFSLAKPNNTKNKENFKKNHFYTIQVGLFKRKDKAEKLKRYYEKKGYKVYITKIPEISEYRVSIGIYKDFKKARIIANKIRKTEKILNTWIIAFDR